MRGIHWSFWLFHSQRPNNTEFWCFDCCYPEKAVEQTVDLSVLGMARCSCGVTFMTMLQNVFFSNDRLTLRYRDIEGSKWLCIYIYIYIYIYQMDCVCQRYHKECSTRTCADDCYNCFFFFFFYIEHHALLSIIGLFQIFQMIPVLSAIRAVCFWQCHLVVTAQQEVTSLSYWSPCQNAFTKWLPPWRKGRISCLWIKSVFGKCSHGIWF